MTDLLVDLDHLTSLAARVAGVRTRLGDVLGDLAAAGGVGADPLVRAWSGFRQRRLDGLRRLVDDVGGAAEALAASRDAYAAVEAAVLAAFAGPV